MRRGASEKTHPRRAGMYQLPAQWEGDARHIPRRAQLPQARVRPRAGFVAFGASGGLRLLPLGVPFVPLGKVQPFDALNREIARFV